MPRSPVDIDPSQLSLFDPLPEPAPARVPTVVAAPGPARRAVAPAPGPAPVVFAQKPAFAHPRAHRELQLEGHRVAYEFRRARRRSIGFIVGPEGLTVSAPKWVGVGEVESALREKARWILRKLQEQQERTRRLQQARVDWRDGTTIPFLGETVIVVIDPRTTGAVLNNAADVLPGMPRLTLHVGLPQGAAAEQLRDTVQSWLQRQARRVFEERCAEYAARLGVRVRRLSLSSASTRWGSASADGSIRLNWRLVHFAVPVIDYVVAHELAHLREMNHSDAFWEVVRSVMPDFEAARGTLKAEVLPVFD
jgi:predicted metal-dependent hydrolase